MDQMDIGANGASKKKSDKTEQPAAPTIGSAETRERVLEALANRCATVDEVQDAVSKATGSHIAAGVIATALDGLVGGGVIDVEKGRYTLAESGLAVLRTRRSLLLKELTAGSATPEELGTKCGIARAQVSIELAELGRRLWVRRCGDALSDTVALTDVGKAVLEGHAAVAAAASTLPTLAPPIVEPPPDFQAKLKGELDEERKKHTDTLKRLAKLTDWLRDHGVNEPDLLITQPTVAAGRKTFTWAKKVKGDDAEKARIFDEVIKIEHAIALAEMKLDSAKADFKAVTSLLDDQIGALKLAAAEGWRELTIEAYRETDWDAGIVVVRAAAGDRELAREPIPKGEQRVIPGSAEAKNKKDAKEKAAKKSAAAKPAKGAKEPKPAAAPAAKTPKTKAAPLKISSFREPILEVFRAAGAGKVLADDEIYERLREKMAPIVINDASRRLVVAALDLLVKAGEIDHGEEGGFELRAPGSDGKKRKGRR